MKLVAGIVLLLAIFVPIACGGDSTGDGDGNDDANGGTGANTNGGASGSGGTSSSGRGGASGTTSTGGAPRGGSAGATPMGGDAGTAPNGGFAGAVPMGGDAGTAPTGGGAGRTGGSGGSGGSGGGGLECESADDCVMFSDCCNCAAVPEGTSIPGCDLVCITDQCTAQQIEREEVTCSFGRCVIDRSCNHALATCDETPAPCPDGQVRTLEDGCFGGCLAPTECRDVTDCTSCGSAVCVIEEPQIRTTGCVDPGGCDKGSYCDCLDACPPSGFVCMEDDDAVHCPCPVC